MKKTLLYIFIFSVFQSLNSQTWQWANVVNAGSSEGYAVCSDLNGNIYLAGAIGNTAIIGSSTVGTAGGSNCLIKFDTNGNIIWAQSIYKGNNNGVNAVYCDYLGNVYFTGCFQGTVSIGTQTFSSSGGTDVFLVKYSSSGAVLWVRTGNGSASDYSNSVCVDVFGNCFITGYFNSPSIGFGSTVLSNSSISQYFIIKYDTNGNLLWANSGNAGDMRSNYVSVSTNGDVVIAGQFSLTSIIGTNTLTSYAANDFFIAKYNSNGNAIWAKSGGGLADDYASCVSIDPAGDIYVTGGFVSATFTAGIYTSTNAGFSDIFILKYNSSGNLLWGKTGGGPNYESGYSLASYSGGVYLTGGPVRPIGIVIGTITLTTNSNFDGLFLVQFDSGGNPIYSTTLNGGGDDVMAINLDNYCNLIFGGDLSTNPTIVGNYTVSHIGSEELFVAKFNTSLTSPTINITGNSAICYGNSTTLTATGATNYTWMNGTINNSMVVNPTLTSSYFVTASTPSLACNITTMQTVSVYPIPSVSIVASASSICSGKSATLIASGANTYYWYNSSNSSTLIVSPNSTSNYSVIGVTAQGCTNSSTYFLSVMPLPTVTIIGNSLICTGEVSTLTAFGANSYSWSSGQQNASIVITPTIMSTYSVIGTSTQGCKNSTAFSFSVMPIPTITINTYSFICIGELSTLTALGANIYTWSTGQQNTVIIITPTATINYSVIGTDTNTGCSANAFVQINVSVCEGLKIQNFLNNQILIYPNPSNGLFTIQSYNSMENDELLIMNTLGQIIQNQKLYFEKLEIDLKSNGNGLYFVLRLKNGSFVSIHKLLIE